ncbi:hypothetical protein PROFUN_04114 [Planoprotostelium fungivorum]|uniref:Actin n=2 Tax=Planoprotostelium fungivorum TaxID=1890364 RepID=A0A2P6NJH6_9EUKA|nr:hypothetical protein PROFUN_04114 [Planoprotostelium fungivorum]
MSNSSSEPSSLTSSPVTPQRKPLVSAQALLSARSPSIGLLSLSPGSNFEIGFTAEKASIVIDIGTFHTRLGFAGDSAPRYILKTQFRRPNGKELSLEDIERTNKSTTSSFDVDEWREAVHLFFNQVYYKYLQCNTKDERKVVIVENMSSPEKFRDVIMYILYEKFKVPSLLFVPAQAMMLAPISLKYQTALVIDIGYNETRLLPIFDGLPVISGHVTAPLGYANVRNRLAQMMEKTRVKHATDSTGYRVERDTEGNVCIYKNSQLVRKSTYDIVDRIITTICYVEPNRAEKNVRELNEKKKKKEPVEENSTFESNLNSFTSVRVTPEISLEFPNEFKSEPLEVLFRGDEEYQSITSLVVESIHHISIDIRSEVCRNLFFVGGTSMIPGMKTRIYRELKEYMLSSPTLSGLTKEVNVIQTEFPANITGWISGSIIGSLDYWSSHGKPRDSYIPPSLCNWIVSGPYGGQLLLFCVGFLHRSIFTAGIGYFCSRIARFPRNILVIRCCVRFGREAAGVTASCAGPSFLSWNQRRNTYTVL